MKSFTIAVLVYNRFGVLNRVTSMFRRRRFNIESLTVSETESPEYSRITVKSYGEETAKDQLIDQLHKLPDVVSIMDLSDIDTVSCELLLIKMENKAETRGDICAAAEAYGAKIVDYTRESMIFRLTDDSARLDRFIDLMRDHTILEICRTGNVSLERGSVTIEKHDIS